MTAHPLPLVELKTGTSQPPIFMAPGGGMDVAEFAGLVKHIQTEHSIYGMQARRIDGTREPFERVEDVAQIYLDAIKKLQPRGPYILIGYSLGGLVALEIAQHLLRNEETIALLAMLDSYPHPRFLTLGQRASLFAQLVKYHSSAIMRLPVREAVRYVVRRVEGRLYAPRRDRPREDDRRLTVTSAISVRHCLRSGDKMAWSRYKPREYTGKIRYVRAGHSTHFPRDAAGVWKRYVSDLELDTLPGHHLGIITNPEHLGALLSRYLSEAFARDESQG